MKKITNLGLLLCCITLLLSCNEDNELQETQDVVNVVAKPDNIISVEDAGMMYDEFGEKRAQFLQNNLTERSAEKEYIATRMVYMKYDKLKNYLAYIEQESANAGVNIESLGFYFSKYPDQSGKMPSGINVSDRQGTENLVLNPMAYFDEVDYEVSYILQENDEGTMEAVPVGYALDALRGENKHDTPDSFAIGKEVRSMAANHGIPRPPPPKTNGKNSPGY